MRLDVIHANADELLAIGADEPPDTVDLLNMNIASRQRRARGLVPDSEIKDVASENERHADKPADTSVFHDAFRFFGIGQWRQDSQLQLGCHCLKVVVDVGCCALPTCRTTSPSVAATLPATLA